MPYILANIKKTRLVLIFLFRKYDYKNPYKNKTVHLLREDFSTFTLGGKTTHTRHNLLMKTSKFCFAGICTKLG